jgi:hypothetical protein
MYQLHFPYEWADFEGHPAVHRVRTLMRRRPPAVGRPPVQAVIPMVRLWDGMGGNGKSVRKCSPFQRAKTINISKLSKRQRQAAHTRSFWDVDLDALRPRRRGDCTAGPGVARPCPFVGCRHHMALTIDLERGSIKENFPELRIMAEPDGDGLVLLEQMFGTCSLDICDKHDDGTSGTAGLLELYHAAMNGGPLGLTPGMTLKEVADAINLGIERVRQLGGQAMQEVRVKLRRLDG